MDVEIHYADPLHSPFTLQISCGYGDIVEETETHDPVDLCMMPGRPYRAEGVIDIASHYHIHRVDNAARRQHGGPESITTKLIVGMVEHIHSKEASLFKA